MENLEDRPVSKQGFQAWGGVVVAVELDEVHAAITSGELDQAKPVAIEIQAQGFRINRNAFPQRQAFRQIILMKRDGGFGHWSCAEFSSPGQVAHRQAADTQELFRELARTVYRLRQEMASGAVGREVLSGRRRSAIKNVRQAKWLQGS